VLEKAAENPILLNHKERELLIEYVRKFDYGIPEFIEFPYPFERAFMYGDRMLNLDHPVTQALLRFVASLELSKMNKTLPEDIIGNLEDVLRGFTDRIGYESRYGEFQDNKTLDFFHKLWSLARETQLFDIEEIDKFVLTPTDFIRLPFLSNDRDIWDFHEIEDILGEIQPFGMPL
jgi:hypothetical protein